MSMFQKLLGMGSKQVAKRSPTALKSADELTKELIEQGPEVIGKGTSRAAKEATEEIPEAIYKEITPTTGMDDMSAWARLDKKKAAALLGLGGAGAYMMSGDDEQPPMVPQEPIKPEEPKKPEEIKKEAKKTVKTEPPSPEGLDFDALAKKFDEGMASLPKDAAATEEAVDEFEEAKRQASDNAVMALLGKAATQIGGGIASLGAGSQVKLDASGFEDLAKLADRPLSQLQEKQKYDKLKAESMDQKAMNDPNSEISRIYHDVAIKAGLIKPGSPVAPAKVYEKFGLGNLLSTIEAGKARKDAAALSRETRAADMLERQRMRSEEEALKRQDKRKLITEEVEDRSRNLNDSIQMLQDTIDKYGTFELTGPQEEDMKRLVDTIATDMAKLADPNSVARPAEVELWKRNLAKVGGLQGLGMTNQTAKDILESFKGEVEKRRQHAYKVRGVSPDNEPTTKMGKEDNNFPRQVRKAGKVATVSNAAELKEAQEEGWQ